MKLPAVLSKAYKIIWYLRRRRKLKLYRQWVEQADLAPGAIPPEEIAEDITTKIDTAYLRLHILYVLLGVALGILGVGLILLVVQSC